MWGLRVAAGPPTFQRRIHREHTRVKLCRHRRLSKNALDLRASPVDGPTTTTRPRSTAPAAGLLRRPTPVAPAPRPTKRPRLPTNSIQDLVQPGWKLCHVVAGTASPEAAVEKRNNVEPVDRSPAKNRRARPNQAIARTPAAILSALDLTHNPTSKALLSKHWPLRKAPGSWPAEKIPLAQLREAIALQGGTSSMPTRRRTQPMRSPCDGRRYRTHTEPRILKNRRDPPELVTPPREYPGPRETAASPG